MTHRTLQAVAIGAAGALLLHVFYRSVKHRWPENYSTLRGTLESSVSGGVLPYLMFRMAPAYLVGVFIGVTANRLHAPATSALITLALVHVMSTNGLASVRLMRTSNPEERLTSLLLYYAIASALVVAAVGLAGWTYRAWTSLIPKPADVVLALWTGLAAAVVAAYIQSFGSTEPSVDELARRARRDVGSDLLAYTEAAANRMNCDPDLLRAIVLAEALQRPAWVRRLERLKGVVFKSGSYGVAQAQAPAPITDEESIDALASKFAGYFPERSPEYGALLSTRLDAEVERHNRKVAFVQMVRSMYDELQGYARAASDARAHDGRPVVEVTQIERQGRSWLLSGTAVVYEGTVQYRADGPNGTVAEGHAQATAGGPSRGRWKLKLPIESRQATLHPEPMDGLPAPDQVAIVDLTDP
jgi:hypothetical protein